MLKTISEFLVDYKTKAKVIGVHDGDTITVTFPFPETQRLFIWKCRIFGIDTPELVTKDPVEKEHALIAKNYLYNLIFDKEIDITCKGFDKYGRTLIICVYNDVNISDDMISKKLGKPYFGKTKEPWSEEDFLDKN
jgi:endonuclease YncB( thermonuclease family)